MRKPVLASTPPESSPEPANVVAEVVDKIRPPAALRLASNGWTRLRSEYEQAQRHLQTLIREDRVSTDAAGRMARQAAIQRAQDELTRINEEIKPAMFAVREARAPYAAAVRSALSPLQDGAATRAIAALDAVQVEFELLDVIAHELQRCGSSDWPPSFCNIYGQMISTLRQRLRRLQ